MEHLIKVEDKETLMSAIVPAIRVITIGGDGFKTPAGAEYKTTLMTIQGNSIFVARRRELVEKFEKATPETVRWEKALEDLKKLRYQVAEKVCDWKPGDDFQLFKLKCAHGADYYVGAWTRRKG